MVNVATPNLKLAVNGTFGRSYGSFKPYEGFPKPWGRIPSSPPMSWHKMRISTLVGKIPIKTDQKMLGNNGPSQRTKIEEGKPGKTPETRVRKIHEKCLGGGFKYFFFHPYLGIWSNWTNIFQMGWNHQLGADDSQNCLRFAQDTEPISVLLATRHAAYGWASAFTWKLLTRHPFLDTKSSVKCLQNL